MRRIYNKCWIIPAFACFCPWLNSCIENDNDHTNVVDTQELCSILSPETIAEMGLDCGHQGLCETGKRKCDGVNVLECQTLDHKNNWVIIDACDNSCRDGKCIDSNNPEPVCEIGAIKCSGSDRVECKEDNDTARWSVIETCAKSCKAGECIDECALQCREGKYACDGKTLTKCEIDNNGCYIWKTQKTCSQYCYADTGKCAEELPTCKLNTIVPRESLNGLMEIRSG